MITFLHVINAEYLDEYRLRISVNDGESGIVDLEPHLWGPVFEPLKDPAVFREFSISGHTITWPNEADFAPEFLHGLLDANRSD